MTFKSDNHRKWYFANKDNLPTLEGVSFDVPTTVGFDKEAKNRLMREEQLIEELKNSRSKALK